jgi:hypothetical protein
VKVLQGFREFGRVLRGSRLFGQAKRLERRGRLPEARVALLDALTLVEGVRCEIISPAAFSTRLFASLAMARIASEMKDPAEAACYARKWLSGWSEFRLGVPEIRRDRKFELLAEWESWARQYIAWSDKQQVQPRMKLEVVGHAETARSAGPLIRLYGRDGQVVRALRRALEGLSQKALALHAVPGIEAIGGCHLAVVRGARGGGVEHIGPRSFVWETDGAGWEHVIELVKPFENPDTRDGFQSLAYGSEIAILISTDGRWEVP